MLAQFAVRLICGMTLVLSAMPHATVASGFFRVQMLIVMGLGVLATLAAQTAPSSSAAAPWIGQTHFVLCILISVLAFVSSVFWTLERRQVAAALQTAIAAISFAALGLGILLISGKWQTHWGVVLASDISSALTLGGAMCGMLLGHSYLTSPTMAISPLLKLNQFLGYAGILRGIISGTVLAVAWRNLHGDSTWIWLTLRWIAGIGGPILVWQMVRRILAFKNTQAATGVLFVGVIFTLLGELTGTLLLAVTGYPL
jgi:hypothetical protein